MIERSKKRALSFLQPKRFVAQIFLVEGTEELHLLPQQYIRRHYREYRACLV